MSVGGGHVCAKLLQSCSTLCDTLWTVACQAPLSMGFSRQVYCCHALLQGIFSTQGLNLCLLQLLDHRQILYCWPSGTPIYICTCMYIAELLCCTLGASLVAQRLKRLPVMWETRVWSLDWEDPLEREMATHSSVLAWEIPWTEEPGGLQSTESQRVGHFTISHTLKTYMM